MCPLPRRWVSLMKNTVLRFNDLLYRVCIGIAGLSVLTMTLIIPWGIFTRYALGSGSSWPEPVAILLMVVFTFFGAAASYRAGAHMAVANTWNQYLGEIPSMRVGISYLPIPIGGIVTLVFILEKLFLGDQSHRAVMRFDVVEASEGAA